MVDWVDSWTWAFGCTLCIEWLIAVPLIRSVDSSFQRRIFRVALLNLVTHPLVWFVFPQLTASYATRTALAEVTALAMETLGYVLLWPGLGLASAGLIALAANAASFGLGVLFQVPSSG